MTADAGLASELSALREELSAAGREPPSPAAEADAAGEKKTEAPSSGIGGVEREHAERVGDFLDVLKELAQGAERTISEHPTASVIGALLLGIWIGRLFGRR